MSEQVDSVRKTGDWYVVKGKVNGRDVSIDVPANQVDGKSRDKALKDLERGLRHADNAGR